jgi:hypothetical protein
MSILNTFLISGLISTFIILLNEWIKRGLDRRHKEKKLNIWKKIAVEGSHGLSIYEKDRDVIYELLVEGIVKIEPISGATKMKGYGIQVYVKGAKPNDL